MQRFSKEEGMRQCHAYSVMNTSAAADSITNCCPKRMLLA